MSKSVLISIKPEWCELIASGKKTIEVRKTRPKLETPFKVYIYCTRPRNFFKISPAMYSSKEYLHLCDGKVSMGDGFDLYDKEYEVLNCKVIGEFMCHDVSTYETEFYPPDKQPIYEAITEWNADNEVWEAVASNNDTYQTNFLKNTCMCLEDFRAYLGVGEIPFYGWHISDLVIYDEPKMLHNFFKPCGDCDKKGTKRCTEELTYCRAKTITRPPQSWCYVEEF